MVDVLRRRGGAAAGPGQARALADHDVAGHRVAVLDLGDHRAAGRLGGHVCVGHDLDVGAALLGGDDRLGGGRDVPAEHRDPQRVTGAGRVEDLDEVAHHCRVAAAVGAGRGEADFVRARRRCCSRRSSSWPRSSRCGRRSGAGVRRGRGRARPARDRRGDRGAGRCRPVAGGAGGGHHERQGDESGPSEARAHVRQRLIRRGRRATTGRPSGPRPPAAPAPCVRRPGRSVVHIGGRLASQEAAVAGGDQPRVEDRHHAAVGRGADQPAGALGEQQRRVGGGDLHEAVAAGLVGGPLARATSAGRRAAGTGSGR